MLNNHGFDLWAGSYDAAVQDADESGRFPFAGYTGLMNAVYGTVMNRAPASVFDIGFGTAVLTSKLYAGGNTITGIDFSAEMLKTAAQKMPKARLLQWDFTKGLPPALKSQTFDFIISTYALHHLTDEAKLAFITELLDVLEPEGAILIGDVCFGTRADLLACQEASGADWDDDEIYFVFSEMQAALSALCSITFHAFSFCAGIIEIRKHH